jgi:molecular chaperone DnaK
MLLAMADEKRTAPRVGAVLRIRLAFGSMDDFVERYAMNISSGGIFVRTRDPTPPGTELGLDVTLQSGDQVISGRGVVRWTTPPSAPGEPHRDPGMGIRFLELTPESRALVDLVVATQGAAARSEEPPLPEDVDPAARGAGPAAPAGAAPAAGAAGAPAAAPSAERSRVRRLSGPVVGIDLGTTNSLVAFAKDGRATVLRCRQGSTTVPSIVAYDPHGRLLVGLPAKAQVVVNPRHTVYGAKRLVGRPFASPTVQACRDRFHYEIVEAAGGAAAVRFAGRDYTLQQIAALVLAELKECASQVLGERVERAVVTVPAHYDDHQRSAVHEAGRLAGLHVERIVNEPTAAALAYGHGKALRARVLVYDLGGGTFDASVLEIRGDSYEVVSTGGDTFLGGLDFDAQLVDHLVFRFMEDQGFAPPDDRAAWQRIRDAAEETKVALSTRERAIAHVPYLCKGEDGKEVDLSVEVTRAELEALTERLVDRSLEICREVLAAKGLRPSDVDEVLLVGGQSRMPLVWRKVAAAFGREPSSAVHPDEAVALGAAILGESIGSAGPIVLVDALAMGIGVGLPGGRMATVLARNTALPARKAYELATTRDGQAELELHVFQGNSAKASECEYLGTVQFRDLPAREKGAVRISVEFALGAEGLLTVTGTDSESGRASVARLATHDTPDSLREKLGFPESPTAPRGARPIDPAPARPARKGFFGRLFGARG